MDLLHGVLLLVIGLFFTVAVFALITYAETPDKEEHLSDIQKQLKELLIFNKHK